MPMFVYDVQIAALLVGFTMALHAVTILWVGDSV